MSNFVQVGYVLDSGYLEDLREFALNDAVWEKPLQGDRTICTDIPDELYPDVECIMDAFVSNLDEVETNAFHQLMSVRGGYTPDVKVSKYTENGKYTWHVDDLMSHEENIGWRRAISTVTYLNDDFVGGETEIYNYGKITPEINKTLSFTSSLPHVHRGKEVTSGTKYLLVIHIWT